MGEPFEFSFKQKSVIQNGRFREAVTMTINYPKSGAELRAGVVRGQAPELPKPRREEVVLSAGDEQGGTTLTLELNNWEEKQGEAVLASTPTRDGPITMVTWEEGGWRNSLVMGPVDRIAIIGKRGNETQVFTTKPGVDLNLPPGSKVKIRFLNK